MHLAHTVGGSVWTFTGLADVLAKASPPRSGDVLAGVAAASAQQRVAARMCLADLPLTTFVDHAVIPYESDDVTRLIVDRHDAEAFREIEHLTVGDFRDWLLSDTTDTAVLTRIAPGVMPEMAAAVSKLMRNQDLITVARKCRIVTRFRDTIGLPGRLAIRLQPNHPTDDPMGIALSLLDGLMYGAGDAVIGINPATDDLDALIRLWHALDEVRARFEIPTQTCVLTHVTSQIAAIERGAPIDLVFQSIAGTQKANASFGITLGMLGEARDAALSLKRATVGDPATANVMYFETGQGSALSASANHGVGPADLRGACLCGGQSVRSLVEQFGRRLHRSRILFDGKQIIRAGLEDHFCGKLMGVPLGCDVCYTNHAEADSDDMDTLMTLLGTAGVTFLMGVPGADDVMLGYQSTSFHDALYLRSLLGLKRAPEFERWLLAMGIADPQGRLVESTARHPLLADFATRWPS